MLALGQARPWGRRGASLWRNGEDFWLPGISDSWNKGEQSMLSYSSQIYLLYHLCTRLGKNGKKKKWTDCLEVTVYEALETWERPITNKDFPSILRSDIFTLDLCVVFRCISKSYVLIHQFSYPKRKKAFLCYTSHFCIFTLSVVILK